MLNMLSVEDYVKKGGIFERIAKKRGWQVNPDKELVKSFAEGLIRNKERYGMAICPCRLATEKKDIDRKIICPCIYADEDVREYGRCFCGLYVSKDFIEGKIEKIEEKPVPDRHYAYYLEA